MHHAQKYEMQRLESSLLNQKYKPDQRSKSWLCTYNQGCYDELMEIREHVIKLITSSTCFKEVTHHTVFAR